MSDNKQNRRRFTDQGYYIALILCAAAIGISGYLYYRNQSEVQQVSVPQTELPQLVVETVPEDLPVIATGPREAETVPETVPAPQAAAPAETAPQTLKTMSPVAGQEIAPFSVEALSYNETTRDWRTHNGVDLSAQEGTPVCAAADGTVYTTYEDDALGNTVVILHNGGYVTRYSSLREDLQVSAGDTVTMGQTIGYAGTTAIVENVLGPHVHFSVSYRDTPMDPADFLS